METSKSMLTPLSSLYMLFTLNADKAGSMDKKYSIDQS